MDLLNNLIFTSINNVGGFIPLAPKYFANPTIISSALPQNRGNYFSYDIDVIEAYWSNDDSDYIEEAIGKHWADLVTGRDYTDGTTIFSAFTDSVSGELIPPYHIVYAYLVENTRISQIFEKLIYSYLHDEILNKATTQQNILAFQWIMNTESLFYKNLSNTSYRNISSQVRIHPESTRRNAYYRLLGMDLAFGDLTSNAPVNYQKAEFNNKPFIVLLEKFLTEIWQAYTNAKNTSGVNTTDMFTIVDTAQKMQEMLMSRRTTESTFDNYRYFNLSKEEYSSVVMMSWFYEAISYDSPLVQFLRCNGNTPGERLINIGKKVGLNAHSKSEGLLDIAPPLNTLLRRIELGDYNPDNESEVRTIIESQVSTSTATDAQKLALTELLLIINNWEKATGHRIKNPESNIRGTVTVAQQQRTNGKAVLTGV